MGDLLPNPHDSLFRGILSDPQEARDFIHESVPVPIREFLADTPPELLSESFVGENLRNRQCDLLFKAGLNTGNSAFIYFLIEHKSGPSPDLPLQLAEYHIQILRKFAKKSNGQYKLPWVIPIVVSSAGKRFSAPSGLAEMIDTCSKDYIVLPGEKHVLQELHDRDTKQLSYNAVLHAAFLALLKVGEMLVMETLARLVNSVDNSKVQKILEYVIRVSKMAPQELFELVNEQKQSELGGIMETTAEQLISIGRQEGRQEGIEKEKTKTLIRLLNKRFGSLSDDDMSRIDQATLKQLDIWTDAIFDASDLPEVFTKSM